MITTLLNQLDEGFQIRQTFSQLRQAIKDTPSKEQLLLQLSARNLLLQTYLSNEDAKTRKNVALLMGDLQCPEYVEPLFDAYEYESTLFVKSAYLTALKTYDCSSLLSRLKDHLIVLTSKEPTIENRKHIEEEIRVLTDIIVATEGIHKHTFRKFKEPMDCILLTNRLHPEVTANQIEEIPVKTMRAGIKICTTSLREILPIRTYTDLLFVIPDMLSCKADPSLAAQTICDSSLLDILTSSHNGGAPFYFRVELKSKMPLDKKSIFTKKLSTEIERRTKRSLINSTSNYEFELRLIQSKTGDFNILLKLNTILDERFSYRGESLATSIKPTNAALFVALCKDYMIADARVLDPFCGVGTMLIERQMQIKANTSYGIDILENAIDKAKANTAHAGQIIHYINRNCLNFEHEYLFDEIFTNMPWAMGHTSQDEIRDLYKNFFKKAKTLLTERGIMILYTHDKSYVKEFAMQYHYAILDEFLITDKTPTHLMVLSV